MVSVLEEEIMSYLAVGDGGSIAPGHRPPAVKRDWRAGAAMTPEKEKALRETGAMEARRAKAISDAAAEADAGTSGGLGGISPMILIGAAALVGVLFYMKKRRGTP